jgi:hypothetical protein
MYLVSGETLWHFCAGEAVFIHLHDVFITLECTKKTPTFVLKVLSILSEKIRTTPGCPDF